MFDILNFLVLDTHHLMHSTIKTISPHSTNLLLIITTPNNWTFKLALFKNYLVLGSHIIQLTSKVCQVSNDWFCRILRWFIVLYGQILCMEPRWDLWHKRNISIQWWPVGECMLFFAGLPSNQQDIIMVRPKVSMDISFSNPSGVN